MSGASVTNLVVGVAVLALVLYRQLTTQRYLLMARAARQEAAGRLTADATRVPLA